MYNRNNLPLNNGDYPLCFRANDEEHDKIMITFPYQAGQVTGQVTPHVTPQRITERVECKSPNKVTSHLSNF